MKNKLLVFLLVLLFSLLLLASCAKDECEKNGHAFTTADCTSAKVCTTCGATEGDPLGHDYTERVTALSYVMDEADTCREYVTYWYGCSRCDAVAGEDSLALDKWYTSDEIGAHSISADWTSEGGKHYHECINDGCEYTEASATCSGGEATCLTKAECSVCGEKYGELSGHSFDLTEWGYPEADGHAHKCTVCGEKDDLLPHTPNVDSATEELEKFCTECGFILESKLPHTHTPATEFEYDGTYHWHGCVKNDGFEFEREEHTFDNECDPDCNGGCGYARPITHDYSVLKQNGGEHWYECSVCGAEKTGSRVPHTYRQSLTVEPKTFTEGLAHNLCDCGHGYEEVLPPTKTLKLLAIGNSFAIDALTHLYIVAESAGVENIVLGYLHQSGCTLDTHYANMLSGEAVYTFGVSNPSKRKMENYNGGEKVNVEFALAYADWDYITLQQGSHDSGLPATYAVLNDVIGYVRSHNPDAELLWHMTWAYQGNSTHSGFANYNNDQITMYNAITSTVKSEILTNDSFVGVIPSGTTVQNMRSSHLGDNLTRDGYHLTTGIGRYAAAMTYLAAVTGYDITEFAPTGLADDVMSHIPCIKEAVANAIKTPYAITPSENYPYVEPEIPEDSYNSTVSPLTEDDRAYLSALGYDPNGYASLDLVFTANAYYDSRNGFKTQSPATTNSLYNKFLATQVIARDELPNGTLIRVNEGYQYRPDGWKANVTNTAETRPDYCTQSLVTVDDAWWGDFDYRGFNLLRDSGTITIEEQNALRIYIPASTPSKLTSLTAEDSAYLTSLGLDPGAYMVYNYGYTVNGFYDSTRDALILTTHSSLSPKFIATEMFTRDTLTNGSVIRIASGYQYRPDGWVSLDATTAKADRPGNVSTEYVTVDDAWWGSFNYRGFNISKLSNAKMTEADATALRIYVKIA